MSTNAQKVLEEFRQLPLKEQRELSALILGELAIAPKKQSHHRSISEIAGKYRVALNMEAKDHDRGFADAALASTSA